MGAQVETTYIINPLSSQVVAGLSDNPVHVLRIEGATLVLPLLLQLSACSAWCNMARALHSFIFYHDFRFPAELDVGELSAERLWANFSEDFELGLKGN